MPWRSVLPTMATLSGLIAQALALILWLAPQSLTAAMPEGGLGSPVASGLLGHVAGSLALSFGLRHLGQASDWRFNTAITAALPVIGGLGLLLTAAIAQLPRTDKRQPAWRRHPLSALPDIPVSPPDDSGQALREGLASVLAQSRDGQLRQEALLQSQHLPTRTAIALMRRGLADDADDIRLGSAIRCSTASKVSWNSAFNTCFTGSISKGTLRAGPMRRWPVCTPSTPIWSSPREAPAN